MNLVLLFFFIILVFILIISFIFICSELRLDIRKINISNIDNGIKTEKINKDILIFLEIYLFGKINIFKINLNKNIFDKINPKSKIKNLRYNFSKLELNKIIKKMKIKKLNINASIGTEEVGMTAILVALFSSVLRNNNKKY